MSIVNDEDSIVNLSPSPMGVLLSFAPSMKGCVLYKSALFTFRRAFGLPIKRLINNDVDGNERDKWSNALLRLLCAEALAKNIHACCRERQGRGD